MLPYLRESYGNASSSHSLGRVARAAVEHAREQLAELINASPADIIFTSGGTEANNLALLGTLGKLTPGRLAISAIEHASLRGPAYALSQRGWQIDSIAVDRQGRVTLDAVRESLHAETRLISVMRANNETGTVQDIPAISQMARRAGVLMHTDAVQALGKMPVDFKASGAHMMSFSAHKIYGPKGVGALVVDQSIALEGQILGGGHEKGLRAGTQNVAAIVGFGAAAELARKELSQRQIHWQELRTYLEERLHELPGVIIFAEQAERLPNTVLISVPEFAGETLVVNLDQAGILLSSGSACMSGSLAPSHVLQAMAVESPLLRNVLRISMGKDTMRAEIDLLVKTLQAQLAQFAPWEKKPLSSLSNA